MFKLVESISDPLKHLVTSTFILFPPDYFKNVFTTEDFQLASIVQWFMALSDVHWFMALSDVHDVLGSIPGSAISFYNVGVIIFLSKFFIEFFFKISSVL